MGPCVIGSINMDLVAEVDRFPVPGETLTGRSFSMLPGGKGANQAVALARLGAKPRMAGKVGDDPFGRRYLRIFEEEGVDAGFVKVQGGFTTGTAVIEVDRSGENKIIIHPGANASVDAEYVMGIMDSAGSCSHVLLQMEIPAQTNLRALQRLRNSETAVIVDPAPAALFRLEMQPLCDILTPNIVEAAEISGMRIDGPEGAREACRVLLDGGTGTVIIKAGGSGAYVGQAGLFEHVPGYAVEVKDSTAAGDAFNAGLTYALIRGFELLDAVRYAHAVAGIACTQVGAQTALPRRCEVEDFLEEHGR
jgi:ribokinase